MEYMGTTFIKGATLGSIEKTEEGMIKCTFNDKDGKPLEKSEEFNTVLLAICRDFETKWLNLENAGVKINKKGKVITNDID